MKRIYLLGVSILFGLMASCEDEDICIEQTTPRLYVEFMTVDGNTPMDSLIVFRENEQGEFMMIEKRLAADSVFIPMPVREQKQTRFIIGTRSYDSNFQDILTIQYDHELEYISKACGYGVRFKNAQFAITNHYFNSLETLQNEISDESAPHLKLSY